jgi:hypothetical protein
MEPVTLITTAIATALAAGSTELGKKAVGDAYERLKSAIQRRFGEDGDLPKALAEWEQKPASEARRLLVQEAVEEARADDDPDILRAARALLEAAGDASVRQTITGDYNAQVAGSGTASVTVSGVKD